jgi:hypothetical protein
MISFACDSQPHTFSIAAGTLTQRNTVHFVLVIQNSSDAFRDTLFLKVNHLFHVPGIFGKNLKENHTKNQHSVHLFQTRECLLRTFSWAVNLLFFVLFASSYILLLIFMYAFILPFESLTFLLCCVSCFSLLIPVCPFFPDLPFPPFKLAPILLSSYYFAFLSYLALSFPASTFFLTLMLSLQYFSGTCLLSYVASKVYQGNF